MALAKRRIRLNNALRQSNSSNLIRTVRKYWRIFVLREVLYTYAELY